MAAAEGIGIYYIVTALIHAASGAVNSGFARGQQKELSQRNHTLQLKMEENRQNFQLEQSERNAALQRELSLQNHQLRLAEQRENFENLCKQAEWNHFLNTWPLMNLPGVIRAEQILPDGTVSLRVIFTRSSDPVFTKAVYPRVEQGLREFVDLYHNDFHSHNLIFYQNGFSGTVAGGAAEVNIHYALRELPVILIDCNVLLDEICVSLTMWGLGSAQKSHFTVFKLPYEPHISNGSFSVDYYRRIADQLLSHLKFVLGCAYDTYNLIQYNRAPLLPRIADLEYRRGEPGCLLDEPGLRDAIREKYGEIYTAVIGNRTMDGGQSYACLPESFKGCILHRIRMEYAEAMRQYFTDTQYSECLDASVEAWAALRTDEPAETFLRALCSGGKNAASYVGTDDRQYLDAICALYNGAGKQTRYGKLVKNLCGQITRMGEKQPAEAVKNVSLPTMVTAGKKPQKRRFNL